MNVNLTTLGRVPKLTVLNIYMPKGNTEKHRHKTCLTDIIYTHRKHSKNIYGKYRHRRAPFHLPNTNCAYIPIHASELCLPAKPSTQADIMSQGPASIDIAYHTISIIQQLT